MIAHNRTVITDADRAAVDAVLASGWIAQGPVVAALEEAFVRRQGGGAACAVASGSAALFTALGALGVRPGDTVAVPSYACTALLNAVHLAGAVPAVVDVDPRRFCLDAALVDRQAPRARHVIAVHTFGASADIAALRAGGRRVLEDCCHTPGGASPGGAVAGAGDAAVFSFYATKVMTGGQGGLVWSADDAVVAAVRDYRQHDGRASYSPRFNLQMTDLQAALALSQFSRLDGIRERRAAIVRALLGALPDGVCAQSGVGDPGRMAQRLVVLLPDAAARDGLRAHLAAAGIDSIVPIERFELLHRQLALDPRDFPVSERLADTALSLPLHLGLTDGDVDRVCAALCGFRLPSRDDRQGPAPSRTRDPDTAPSPAFPAPASLSR